MIMTIIIGTRQLTDSFTQRAQLGVRLLLALPEQRRGGSKQGAVDIRLVGFSLPLLRLRLVFLLLPLLRR